MSNLLRQIHSNDLPAPVLTVITMLKSAGYDAYLVGGSLRDLLIGRTPHDYDIATNAQPERVMTLFAHTIPTGIRYGTVTVLEGDMSIEVTTYRLDGDYSDGRRPDSVVFSDSIEEDLARRDFTINAIAYDVIRGSVVDPFHGQWDLEDRIIRSVGEPKDRFREDALRMLRGIRLACQLHMQLSYQTILGIVENASLLANVAMERIREELNKILLSDPPEVSWGIGRLSTLGLLGHFLPELEQCRDFDQRNPNHHQDVFDHTRAVVMRLPPVLHLRLAGLLHDIAKPCTFTMAEDGIGHFYGHEDSGAEMAEGILRRLTYDHDTIDRVVFLVQNHMFPGDMGRKGMRRFIARVGEQLEDLLILRQADAAAGKTPADVSYLDTIRQMQAEMEEEGVANPATSLAINGHDVMHLLGIKQGPLVGQLLAEMRERIVDCPELNTRQSLLDYLAERGGGGLPPSPSQIGARNA